ncbi:MAG: cell wall-binding repeat-containing protein [Clostridioides sp.]|nr:cell wall-binding repeat-containing protein [Clostridioides sp.]
MKYKKLLTILTLTCILFTSVYVKCVDAGGAVAKSKVGITFKNPYRPGEDPSGGDDTDVGGSINHESGAIVLASGEKYTDVLTASVLANELETSLLLTKKNATPGNTLDEIDRLKAKMVVVVGGTDSVSNSVASKLSKYKVVRLAGHDRYDTSIRIAEEVRRLTGNLTEATLVSGVNFPDIISISTFSSLKGQPILITDPEKITKTTADAISDWKISNITIGGGYNSVSKNIENNLKAKKVNRMGGANRYETAKIISEKVTQLTGNKKDMILVDGTNFPDGICINSLATLFKAPILLTTPDSLHKIVAEEVKKKDIQYTLIGGGYKSVSQKVQSELKVKNVERVFGSDRYETAVKISQRYSNKTLPLGVDFKASWKN